MSVIVKYPGLNVQKTGCLPASRTPEKVGHGREVRTRRPMRRNRTQHRPPPRISAGPPMHPYQPQHARPDYQSVRRSDAAPPQSRRKAAARGISGPANAC